MGTSFISKHCEIQESALSASKLSSSISGKGGEWGLRPPRRQCRNSPFRQSFLTTTMRESPKRLHE
ncbi:hypothetical protein [Prevotella nigrescens]